MSVFIFPIVMFALIVVYLLIMLAFYGLSSQRRSSYEKRQSYSIGGTIYGAAIVLWTWSSVAVRPVKDVRSIGWMDAVQQFVDQYYLLLLIFGVSLASVSLIVYTATAILHQRSIR